MQAHKTYFYLKEKGPETKQLPQQQQLSAL